MPFELKTDHHGLRYIFTKPNLNSRKRRWLEFLSEYNFAIDYIKGRENKVVNALRRRRQLVVITATKTTLRQQVLHNIQRDENYDLVKNALETSPPNHHFYGYTLE